MIRVIRTYFGKRRLAASLKPDGKYLSRRAAAKRGWQRRRHNQFVTAQPN